MIQFRYYFVLKILMLLHYCGGSDVVTEETLKDDVVYQSINEMYDAYLEAEKTGQESLTRRFYKDRKGFMIHVSKLGEVNGLKAHNIMLIQDDFLQEPVIYISNPVESESPFAVLNIEEFKDAMLKRSMKQQAEFEYQKLAAQMGQVKRTGKPITREVTILRSATKSKDKIMKTSQPKTSTTRKIKKTKPSNKKKVHSTEKRSKKYINPIQKQTKTMTTKVTKVTEKESTKTHMDTTATSTDIITADTSTYISEISDTNPTTSTMLDASTVPDTVEETSIVSDTSEIGSITSKIPDTSSTMYEIFKTSLAISETTPEKVPVLETAEVTTETTTTQSTTAVTTMSVTTVSTPRTRGRPFVFIGGAFNK